jgi:hypothetical protein
MSIKQLEAFIASNGSTMEGLPGASKDAVWTAVSDVRVRIEARAVADEIDVAEGAPKEAPIQTEDLHPDVVWTNDLIARIQNAESKLELGGIVGSADVPTKTDEIKETHPECYDRIAAAYKAKLDEFKPKK